KIDPVYFDKPYYLGPEKGADRAYRLLAEAMRRSGRTALARYAARGKQYLVQIRPLPEGGLVMQTLLYADEVRPCSEVESEKSGSRPSERRGRSGPANRRRASSNARERDLTSPSGEGACALFDFARARRWSPSRAAGAAMLRSFLSPLLRPRRPSMPGDRNGSSPE